MKISEEIRHILIKQNNNKNHFNGQFSILLDMKMF